MDTKYIYILKSWRYKADQGTNLFLLIFSIFYKHPQEKNIDNLSAFKRAAAYIKICLFAGNISTAKNYIYVLNINTFSKFSKFLVSIRVTPELLTSVKINISGQRYQIHHITFSNSLHAMIFFMFFINLSLNDWDQ